MKLSYKLFLVLMIVPSNTDLIINSFTFLHQTAFNLCFNFFR